MKLIKLDEARRNPAINKKIDILQTLRNISDSLDNFGNSGYKNGFVSMSFLVKLGINPKPIDDGTPVGIYAYPIDYVIDQISNMESPNLNVLPFAGDRPFVHIFSVKNPEKILNLQEVNFKNLISDMLPLLSTREKTMLEQFIFGDEGDISDAVTQGNFYNLIQRAFKNAHHYGMSGARRLTSVFTKLGYEGIFDDGDGQIAIEPHQIVCFSASVITPIDMHFNYKHDLDDINRSRYEKHGSKFMDFNRATKIEDSYSASLKLTNILRRICLSISDVARDDGEEIENEKEENIKKLFSSRILNSKDLVSRIENLFEMVTSKRAQSTVRLKLVPHINSIIGQIGSFREDPKFWFNKMDNQLRSNLTAIRMLQSISTILKFDAQTITQLDDKSKQLKVLIDAVVWMRNLISGGKFKKLAVKVNEIYRSGGEQDQILQEVNLLINSEAEWKNHYGKNVITSELKIGRELFHFMGGNADPFEQLASAFIMKFNDLIKSIYK